MKLSYKTLQLYLICSLVTFVVSVPVFYFLVQDLWIQDVDESLLYQKEKIVKGINDYDLDTAAAGHLSDVVSRLDLGVTITPLQQLLHAKDSIYYNSYYDTVRAHVEPFRELSSYVYINDQPYQLILRKDLVESADLVRGIVIVQVVLFLILLGGLLLLNSYFSKKIWQPFYQVVNQLKSFKLDREERISMKRTPIMEFNELHDGVQRLTENSIRIFKAQKEFTENAAHETQTPLSVIKNQADLLVQDKDLSSMQAGALTRIDKNVRLLTKLNRNLLLLSKIENDRFDLAEDADVYKITTETIAIFEEQIKLNGITLTLNLQARPVISSNTYLLQSLFTNLFTNAIRHNVPHGWIEAGLYDHSFQLVNTGPGHSLPEDKIYERFYKGSGHPESSGLGLAIARRICNTLNFSLQYRFLQENQHSFTIGF